MSTLSARRPRLSMTAGPTLVFDRSFEGPDALRRYGGEADEIETPPGEEHLADDCTREFSRRMHFAAYRCSQASSVEECRFWTRRYLAWRDRIVLGNIKLVFKAATRCRSWTRIVDDLTADCQLVLIKAVASFNPWVGIRFSTFAFTCLLRALSRQKTRYAVDHLTRAVSLEALAEGEPRELADPSPIPGSGYRFDEYLQAGHPLLSDREKLVVTRRFLPSGDDGAMTLEEVGRELGVSKERVRQLQSSALTKLKAALLEVPCPGDKVTTVYPLD